MDPIDPKLPDELAQADEWSKATYAANQPQYNALPSVRNINLPQVPVISAWALSVEEIAYIILCHDIGVQPVLYHEQWTFKDSKGNPNPLQPIRMWFGDPVAEGQWLKPSAPLSIPRS